MENDVELYIIIGRNLRHLDAHVTTLNGRHLYDTSSWWISARAIQNHIMFFHHILFIHFCFKCSLVIYLHTGWDKNAAAYWGWQPYGTVCFVVQGSRLCIGYFPETVHIRRLIFMMTSSYWNAFLIAFREWNPPPSYKWLKPIMHVLLYLA